MWGSEPSQQCKTSLVLLFSSLWVTHPVVMGFDFIMIAPSYHVTTASCLSLDMGYLFLVGSNIFLLMIIQQLAEILVFPQEKMSMCSSTPPFCVLHIKTQTPQRLSQTCV